VGVAFSRSYRRAVELGTETSLTDAGGDRTSGTERYPYGL